MEEKDRKTTDPLPEEFETFEELAEFWDTHDLTDYEESLNPVSLEVVSEPTHEYVITLSSSLNTVMREAQKKEGVSVNTLVNLWIQEKLQQYQATSS
jgi:hypothetical protein